jgi:hypothetical protein
MHLTLRYGEPLQTRTACLVLGAFTDRWQEPVLRELDRLLGGRLQAARRSGEFTGKANEFLLLQPAAPAWNSCARRPAPPPGTCTASAWAISPVTCRNWQCPAPRRRPGSQR